MQKRPSHESLEATRDAPATSTDRFGEVHCSPTIRLGYFFFLP